MQIALGFRVHLHSGFVPEGCTLNMKITKQPTQCREHQYQVPSTFQNRTVTRRSWDPLVLPLPHPHCFMVTAVTRAGPGQCLFWLSSMVCALWDILLTSHGSHTYSFLYHNTMLNVDCSKVGVLVRVLQRNRTNRRLDIDIDRKRLKEIDLSLRIGSHNYGNWEVPRSVVGKLKTH